MMMRICLTVALFIFLGGCALSDQKAQVASCTLDATRAHPGNEREMSPEGVELEKIIGRDIVLCMRKNGYEQNLSDRDCQPRFFNESLEEQDYCYLPSGYVDKAMFRIERWIELQAQTKLT